MRIRENSITRGRATTTIIVEGFAADRPVSDDMIAGFAMRAANENPSSLFGWQVQHIASEGAAVVFLHTD
jgi:hypothetical protein